MYFMKIFNFLEIEKKIENFEILKFKKKKKLKSYEILEYFEILKFSGYTISRV